MGLLHQNWHTKPRKSLYQSPKLDQTVLQDKKIIWKQPRTFYKNKILLQCLSTNHIFGILQHFLLLNFIYFRIKYYSMLIDQLASLMVSWLSQGPLALHVIACAHATIIVCIDKFYHFFHLDCKIFMLIIIECSLLLTLS